MWYVFWFTHFDNANVLFIDHIVELQFIADKINAKTAICTKLTTSATDFKAFFDFINASPNLVSV